MDYGALGQSSPYPHRYDPGLLYPIARDLARAQLPHSLEILPMVGVDIWRAYEISVLNLQGKPVVYTGVFEFPADSPHLIESKSLKLYLNGFNQEALLDAGALTSILKRDLSRAAGTTVDVQLQSAPSQSSTQAPSLGSAHEAPIGAEWRSWPVIALDELDIACTHYDPDSALLKIERRQPESAECFVSHLFKSNCPVTGQPDWACIRVFHHGAALDPAQLLQYLVAYRNHAGFHENCVERIFCDLWSLTQPRDLSVQAFFTRRGGLDINPWRSTRKAFATLSRELQWRQ